MTSFEHKISGFCSRNSIRFEWQPIKLGYQRACIPCQSYEEMHAIEHQVKRLKNVRVETWSCGVCMFEGYIYIYDVDQYMDILLYNLVEAIPSGR